MSQAHSQDQPPKQNTFRTKIKGGEVLSDLEDQKPTSLAAVQCWVWGALWRNWNAALLLSGVVCIYIFPSFLLLWVLVIPDVCMCPFVTPGKHEWAGNGWFS